MRDYYIVRVDDNGDVAAIEANEQDHKILQVLIKQSADGAFENQGNDNTSKWESVRDALASIMPDDEE